MNFVVVGNGVAGIEAAIALRHREAKAQITIVSEESQNFFSRTALMYILSGQLTHRDTEPYERDLYVRMGFVRVRARAVGVDCAGHRVLLAGGLPPVSYDRLLIACGSCARPAPWPGSELAGVGHFVTHQDLSWLEKELHGGASRGGPAPSADAHLAVSTPDSPYRERSVAAEIRGHLAKTGVVIGGGLIGIEVVETMLAAGVSPHFFIREEWFWPIAINRDESGWIAERLREHGVAVHLEREVERLKGRDSAITALVTTDGEEIEVDVAVVTIGVVPNTAWLADSDIKRQDRGGAIVVGSDLRTSDPDVFAAGDCAAVEWFNGMQRPEQLWYTGRDQGRLVARSMLDDEVVYKRSHWYNSAKLMDIEYTTAGLVDFGYDDMWSWYLEESGTVRSTTRIVCRGERVVGFNALGRRWDHRVVIQWIAQRRSLSWVLSHLREAAFDTELVPPLKIPDDRITQAALDARAHAAVTAAAVTAAPVTAAIAPTPAS